MRSYNLLDPIFDNGVQNTHFFNGRLLTAAALQDEQTAQRQQRAQLGQAVGAGVVQGLEVRLKNGGATPVVTVTEGLAINRQGEAVSLSCPVDIALQADTTSAVISGLFAACEPASTFVARAGVYILVAAPASDYSGEVPLHALGGNGVATECGSRYVVEGIQFRLVSVDISNTLLASAAIRSNLETAVTLASSGNQAQRTRRLSRLRNLLAYWCLGHLEGGFAADLYTHMTEPAPETSLLDKLRNAPTPSITDCDVPLALIYWTVSGVQFVDMWAVRRRVARLRSLVPPVVNDQQVAIGEATFLQFQAHLADLMPTTTPQSTLDGMRADSYFYYLPAAGTIPLTGLGGGGGLDYQQFFTGITVNPPVVMEGTRVRSLLHHAFIYDPVFLSSGEMFWLYFVRQNRDANINLPFADRPQHYLIFTSGHLPYQGDAQYDLYRVHFSNVALPNHTIIGE